MMNTAKKIKILMIKKEVSGSAIARQMGVDRTAVYHVLSGRSKSPRLRQAIADAIGVDVSKFWPNGKKAA